MSYCLYTKCTKSPKLPDKHSDTYVALLEPIENAWIAIGCVLFSRLRALDLIDLLERRYSNQYTFYLDSLTRWCYCYSLVMEFGIVWKGRFALVEVSKSVLLPLQHN